MPMTPKEMITLLKKNGFKHIKKILQPGHQHYGCCSSALQRPAKGAGTGTPKTGRDKITLEVFT